jgi:hypothetical protein
MKINRQLLTIGLLAGLAVATVSTHASASVSNPQNFEWDLTAGHDSRFQFKSGEQILIDGSGTAYFTSDVDSGGTQSNFGTALASGSMVIGTHTITALVQIQSVSAGSIDPAAHDVRFILVPPARARVLDEVRGLTQTHVRGGGALSWSTAAVPRRAAARSRVRSAASTRLRRGEREFRPSTSGRARGIGPSASRAGRG